MLDRMIPWLTRIFLVLVIIGSLLPAAIIMIISFSGEQSVRFPPETYGFDQYVRAVTEGPWMSSAWLSVQIGFFTAVLSLLLGIPTAFVAVRSSLRWRWGLFILAASSMLIPVSAYAVALYGSFSIFGILGTETGIVLSHVLLALPVATIILVTGLTKIPANLDQVATTLGAQPWQATLSITGRLLLPTAAAAFIAAFLTSFDEAVFVSFLGGIGITTLPAAIFESLRFGLDPAVTAIGALLLALNAALISLRFIFQRASKTQ